MGLGCGAGPGADRQPQVQPTTEQRQGVDDGFVPAPHQFGLGTFTLKATSRFTSGDVGAGLAEPLQQVDLAMHVEDYGARVGLITIGRGHRETAEAYYWDGAQGVRQDRRAGTVTPTGKVRRETTQPPFLAVADAAVLAEGYGYAPAGTAQVAGRTCERFVARTRQHEFCRWRHILLYSKFFDAHGAAVSATEVTEIVEGEGIPPAILALANMP